MKYQPIYMPINYANNLGQNLNKAVYYQQLRPNHNQMIVIPKKNEEIKGVNQMNKAKNSYYLNLYNQNRNSDGHLRVNRLPVPKGQQRNSNRGLYDDMKQLNSIVEDGKLIYNIDVNNDTQGAMKDISNNYKNYINDKKYVYNNKYNIFDN